MDISNACIMPFGYGVGNHQAFILDLSLESLFGINLVKIFQPEVNNSIANYQDAVRYTLTASSSISYNTIYSNAFTTRIPEDILQKRWQGRSLPLMRKERLICGAKRKYAGR
jgi:hypothetical protein